MKRAKVSVAQAEAVNAMKMKHGEPKSVVLMMPNGTVVMKWGRQARSVTRDGFVMLVSGEVR